MLRERSFGEWDGRPYEGFRKEAEGAGVGDSHYDYAAKGGGENADDLRYVF